MDSNLYERLGVARDATKAEIKKAYRKLSQTMHPDKGGDSESFNAISEAHKVLTDDEARREYDETGFFKKTANNDDAEVVTFLRYTLIAVMAQCHQVEYVDIVARLRQSIDGDIMKADRNKTEAEKIVAETERLIVRFKGGKGAALLQSMLKSRINEARAGVVAMDHAIAMRRRALEMIADAEFEPAVTPQGSSYPISKTVNVWFK